jgi:hypothetical protein
MLSNIEEDKWDELRPCVRELLAQNTAAQGAMGFKDTAAKL